MNDLAISGCQPGDVDEVVALWAAAGLVRPWNDPVADFAQAVRKPHSTVLAGRAAGRIVSSAMVGEDGHRGWLYDLGVAPGQRGLGFGRQTLLAAERWLLGRGVSRLNLLVRAPNAEARSFYRHMGYELSDVVCLQKRLA